MNPKQQGIADEEVGMEEALIRLAGELGGECKDYDRSPTRTKHHERGFYIDLSDLLESAESSELVGANALIHRGVEVLSFEPHVRISLEQGSAVRITERCLLRVWRARVKSDSAAIFYERRWHPDRGVTWGYLSDEEIELQREKKELAQAGKARLLLGILRNVSGGGDTRPYDPWENKLSRFVAMVDDWYPVVAYAKKFAIGHWSNPWQRWLDSDGEFQKLAESRDEAMVMQVKSLVFERVSESRKDRTRSVKSARMPLSLTCQLSARWLQIEKSTGTSYAPDTLVDQYHKGGGSRQNQ